MKVGDLVKLSGELWVIKKIGNDRHMHSYVKVRAPTDVERCEARLRGVSYEDNHVSVGKKKRIYCLSTQNKAFLSHFPPLRGITGALVDAQMGAVSVILRTVKWK